ncbi:MAG TPA: patatin-like phospholipase family protein [Terriglobia bacterium]|nr:patatin-like phospholipase family protein [Terriglobia bacterium]
MRSWFHISRHWKLLGLCFLLLCSTLKAEQSPRRRIGLALAGGSALGLAHVGVLKWLQEHRIPVDMVAGTSMGGLVGGLYASGYDVPEIEDFLSKISWEDALRSAPLFPDLAFRRKEDRREFPNLLEFGLKGGFRLPSGLSSGHGVGLVIARFASPYGDMKSFDDLPTPFRCVAVDLKEGNQVVFQSGSLFDALRATMAIPAIFSPWKVGDKVLVDGGTLNNLPVDVVQSMGADFIIAVPLKGQSLGKNAPTSLLGVAGRSIDIMIAGNESQYIKLANVVVTPNLSAFESSDFRRSAELERIGYESTALKAAELLPLAVDEGEWATYVTQRQHRRRPSLEHPNFLAISGASPRQNKVVEKEVSLLAGGSYSTKDVETLLTRFTGWGHYASADYRVSGQSGKEGYLIRLHEKEYGPPFLNTLILLDGSQSDGLRFGLGGRLTFLDFKGPLSEWRTDFNIGTLNQVGTEYYWRIRASRFFLAPRVFFEDSTFDVYDQGTKILSIDYHQPAFGADFGYAAGRFDEVRLGYQIGHARFSQSEGSPIISERTGNLSFLRARWEHEGQDSPMVPHSGIRTVTEARYTFSSPIAKREYPQIESLVSFAHPINSRYTILNSISGGVTGNNQLPVPLFSLGGPLRLSALSRNEQYGSRYYYGDLALLRSLFSQPTSLGKFYLEGVYEIGRAFSKHQSANPYQDGAVGLVGETFIGVVFLGVSYGEGGQFKVLFRMGRIF